MNEILLNLKLNIHVIGSPTTTLARSIFKHVHRRSDMWVVLLKYN